jgi:hypothetical protein
LNQENEGVEKQAIKNILMLAREREREGEREREFNNKASN